MKTQGAPYTKDSECDLAAERVVLATVFLGQDEKNIKRLDEADFVDPLHKLIIKAFKDLMKRGAPVEMTTLQPLLRTPEYTKHKRACGVRHDESLPMAAALELDEFSNPANLEYYIRVLRKDRMRRWLLRFGEEIQRKARDTPLDPMDTMLWIKKKIPSIIKQSGLEVEQ